jgi:hypothetical protein
VIAPQQARVVFIDYTFGSPGDAPKYVLHHLYLDGAPSPVMTTPVAVDYTVIPYRISASGPITIGPPLKGNNWVALNGCCEPDWPHRSSPLPLNGNLVGGQLFAIDWKQTNNQGAFYTGDKTKNESYTNYGSEIIAVADGTVTSILDGQNANAPGLLPAEDPVLGPKLTVDNVDGNHIARHRQRRLRLLLASHQGQPAGQTRGQGHQRPANRQAGQHRATRTHHTCTFRS